MTNLQKLTYLLFALILSTILSMNLLFALDNSNLYSVCNQFNSEQKCSEYINFTDKVSQIIDLGYTKDLDLDKFVNCVDSEKLKSNFDYKYVRSDCYNNILNKSAISFKANCFYDLNGIYLNVKCKGIFPSEDYSFDVTLGTDANKNVLIQPKIVLNSDFQLDRTKFDLITKQFDLLSLNISPNSDFGVSPLTMEVKNNPGSLSLLLNNNLSNANSMDPLYRSYLDCITIKVLLASDKGNNFALKKSGYTFLYDSTQLINSCRDDIAYSFAIDLTQYDSKRKTFFEMLDVILKNYLSDSNFDVDNMSLYLSSIAEEYQKFASIEKKFDQKTDIVLKLNLDADFFLQTIQKAIKGLSDEEKKTVLFNAGPTILKNKEDSLNLKRKTKLFAIIDFFNKDKDNITDDSLKQIYSDVEYNLIKKHLEDSNTVDLTYVDAKLSSQGISLDGFNFDYNTLLYLNYKDDENNIISIVNDENGLTLESKDYKINTVLSLELMDNSILVSNKEIVLIDKSVLETIYRGKAEIKSLDLIIEDSLPVYLVKKEISGKLLGIINITEKIESKYYATTGIIYKTQKHWWDFLVLYNS